MEHEFQVWSDTMGYKWRFYVKVAAENQFVTRFPNAKCIEELSHFGNFFMKTVPDAIIKIEKWAGDVEPFAVMEETWFRVKGIPMRYRNKSTVYYVASMAGVPLALDMNFLRNFAYVRVKIGCQDLLWSLAQELAPSKRGSMNFNSPGKSLILPLHLLIIMLQLWKILMVVHNRAHQKGKGLGERKRGMLQKVMGL
jgi:hypothetical protein